MKSHSTMILFFCFAINSFAQLTVEKPTEKTVIGIVKNGGIFNAELLYVVGDDKDTTYSLMYQNQKYPTITDIKYVTFSSDGGTVDLLYSLLKGFFSEENKKNKEYQLQIKLGEQQVTLLSKRMLGAVYIQVLPEVGYFNLTEKQVEKLFGKNITK